MQNLSLLVNARRVTVTIPRVKNDVGLSGSQGCRPQCLRFLQRERNCTSRSRGRVEGFEQEVNAAKTVFSRRRCGGLPHVTLFQDISLDKVQQKLQEIINKVKRVTLILSKYLIVTDKFYT